MDYKTPKWCPPNSERDIEMRFMFENIEKLSRSMDYFYLLDVGFAGNGYIDLLLGLGKKLRYVGVDDDQGRILGDSLHISEEDRNKWRNTIKKIPNYCSRVEDLSNNFLYQTVMAISVIEHIVPMGYARKGYDSSADIKAVEAMKKLVIPGGNLLLTFPCGIQQKFRSEKNPNAKILDKKGFKVCRHDILIFNEDRINKVVGNWNIKKLDYYYELADSYKQVGDEVALTFLHSSSVPHTLCCLLLENPN